MSSTRNSDGYYDTTAGIALRNIERNEKAMDAIRRGDIFFVEKFAAAGSEQQSGRPALVVSNNKCNQYSEVVEVVYLTTAPKKYLPTHVTIRSTGRESAAICEQVSSVSKERFQGYIATASASEMTQIDAALLISLDLTMDVPATLSSHSEETGGPTSKAMTAGQTLELSSVGENVELVKENVRLSTQLEIYRSLYAEMTERAMRRVANA